MAIPGTPPSLVAVVSRLHLLSSVTCVFYVFTITGMTVENTTKYNSSECVGNNRSLVLCIHAKARSILDNETAPLADSLFPVAAALSDVYEDMQ